MFRLTTEPEILTSAKQLSLNLALVGSQNSFTKQENGAAKFKARNMSGKMREIITDALKNSNDSEESAPYSVDCDL